MISSVTKRFFNPINKKHLQVFATDNVGANSALQDKYSPGPTVAQASDSEASLSSGNCDQEQKPSPGLVGKLARFGWKTALASNPLVGIALNARSAVDGLETKQPMKSAAGAAGVLASTAATAMFLAALPSAAFGGAIAVSSIVGLSVLGGVLHGIGQLGGDNTAPTFSQLEREGRRLREARKEGQDVTESIRANSVAKAERSIRNSKIFALGAAGAGLGFGLSVAAVSSFALIPLTIAVAVKPTLKANRPQ